MPYLTSAAPDLSPYIHLRGVNLFGEKGMCKLELNSTSEESYARASQIVEEA